KRPSIRRLEASNLAIYFSAKAPVENCTLLSLDERVFPVPKMEPGYPGISSSFFPDVVAPTDWVSKIRKYVINGSVDLSTSDNGDRDGNVDPERRKEVEMAAIRFVTKHYRRMKFNVTSCEKDNQGWDLNARRGGLWLKAEVKGLSGDGVVV